MSAEESPKNKTPAAKPDKATKAATDKAKTAAGAKDEKKASPKAAAPKTKVPAAGVEEQAKVEHGSTEAQEALVSPPVEEEQKHQTEQEQAPFEPKSDLAEPEQAAGIDVEETELAPSVPEEGATEQRFSFVVRLTVDQWSHPRRTEVEHVHSGKKETFPGLDGHRLAAFMQACLRSPAIPEATTSAAPALVSSRTTPYEHLESAARLIVSEVQIVRADVTGRTALILNPAEAFLIQTRFQLQGQEAPGLTAQAALYEIQAYAHEVSGGGSTLLTTYKGVLVKDVLEYTAQMRASGLPSGLYRLIILINLREPVKMVGHYEGPIIQVIGARELTSEFSVDQT